MSTTSQLDEPIDGRAARAVRTRDAIVDACLGLIDEGDPRPTGPRIAERAQVSVRSVFQHFDDLETLFSAVGQRVSERLAQVAVPISADLSLEERVAAFAVQRGAMLEGLTPVLRAALVHAAGSAVITRQFDEGQQFFRRQVGEVFAAELAASSDPDRLADALVAASSWPTWDLWRVGQGRSVDEAARSMAWMLKAALSGVEPREAS